MQIVFMRHPAGHVDNALNNLGYQTMLEYARFVRVGRPYLPPGSIVLSYRGDPPGNGNWATLEEVYLVAGEGRPAELADFPLEDRPDNNQPANYWFYPFEPLQRESMPWVEAFSRRNWMNARQYINIVPFDNVRGDIFDYFRETPQEEQYWTSVVREARNITQEERNQKLADAPRIPETFLSISTGFRRNPYVVAEILERAEGKCQNPKCHKSAPFLRASDQSPYLEVHHKRPLAHGGEDTVDNAIALCPNCHREAHFGGLTFS